MLHHTDPTLKNYISKSLFSPTHTDLTPFKVDKQHKNTNDATQCLFLRSLLVLKNAILLGSESWYRKKRGTKTNKQQQQ